MQQTPSLGIIKSQAEHEIGELAKSQSDADLQSKYKPGYANTKQMSVDPLAQIKLSRRRRGDSFVVKNASNKLLDSKGNLALDDTNVRYIVELVTKSISNEFNNSVRLSISLLTSLIFCVWGVV